MGAQTEFTSTQHIMWKLLLLALLGVCVADRVPSIINGEDVDYPGKYPWQISLQKYGSHICGGSIVSANWIMTAGHCVDASASSMSVVAGMHDMRQRYGTPVRYQIERVYRHESYGRGSGGTPNDIAMLKLKSPISFNSHTKAIAIDKTGAFTGSSDCVISGWGNMIAGGHVCLRNGQTGACMGDSGGPLACRNGSGDWHLVGATSWGSGSCNVGSPSVYTRLSYY